MRCATFNVLADAYTSYGDYSHIEAGLLEPGARTDGIVKLIDDLNADIVGLQEVELPLIEALESTNNWQTFWTPKGNDKPDGCLTIVKHGIEVQDFESYNYQDGSGHIAQTIRIGKTVLANTHIKWSPSDSVDHIGVSQAKELIGYIGPDTSAVILTDCNDQPGGPVRDVIRNAGFINFHDDEATAIVNHQLVSIDLLAVRGLLAKHDKSHIDVGKIPNKICPSDHRPLVAEIMPF